MSSFSGEASGESFRAGKPRFCADKIRPARPACRTLARRAMALYTQIKESHQSVGLAHAIEKARSRQCSQDLRGRFARFPARG